ncbi:MAG: DUF177 domain-containing protein [Ignavibacteriaceae bacterium]|jgi:uncharacterized protein
MILKIANLSEGIHELFFDGKPGEIGLPEPFINSYKMDLRMDKRHNQIVLNVTLALEAKFTCDRCLEEFIQPIETTFQHVYLFGTEAPEDENESVTYLSFEADKVDISPELYDYAEIAIPLKKVCNAECKGLCSHCGTNLNVTTCSCKDEEIDDRWLPLQKLKNIPPGGTK